MSISLIIGAGGQDGTLLTKHLQGCGENVLRIGNGWLEERIGAKTQFDLFSQKQLFELIKKTKPDRVFYLAAYHHSSSQKDLLDSDQLWEKSEKTHVAGFRYLLESVRSAAIKPSIFYAASSLVFGNPKTAPQSESTSLQPVCVYGITKTTGVHLSQFYRNTYQLRVNVGYLYTHESTLRGDAFVAKKIVNGLKAIALGTSSELTLGDLSAEVDWGYAPDFVRAMDLITQQPRADDYVISTGEVHTVGEFAQIGCRLLGLDFQKTVRENSAQIVRQPRKLLGDSAHLRKVTGWRPSVTFSEMVEKLFDPTS